MELSSFSAPKDVDKTDTQTHPLVEIMDLTSSPSEVVNGMRMPHGTQKTKRGTSIVVRNPEGHTVAISAVWEGLPLYGIRRARAIKRASRQADRLN